MITDNHIPLDWMQTLIKIVEFDGDASAAAQARRGMFDLMDQITFHWILSSVYGMLAGGVETKLHQLRSCLPDLNRTSRRYVTLALVQLTASAADMSAVAQPATETPLKYRALLENR